MARLPALTPRRRKGMVPYEPEPGYWLVKKRLKRGWGPPMPASISRIYHVPGEPENILSTGPILIANIGWRVADPEEVWTMRRFETLTKEQYELRMADLEWILDYAPDEPEAKPDQAVDLAVIPPIGPK